MLELIRFEFILEILSCKQYIYTHTVQTNYLIFQKLEVLFSQKLKGDKNAIKSNSENKYEEGC
jgi:hypothetical protein